jgi:3-oxoacyl-[acyl-carrier protein] reductase
MLVTGASSGIGRAIAIAAARAGASLAITYRRNRRGAEETAAAISGVGGGAIHLFELDLARPGAVETLVAQLDERIDALDAWVNNAGADILTGEGRSLTRQQKLDAVLDVDLRAPCSRPGPPSTTSDRDSGRRHHQHVVGSRAQRHGGREPRHLFRGEGRHPRLQQVAGTGRGPVGPRERDRPGFIDTAFGDEASAEWRAHVERVTPLGRWGTPEDVAQAAVYLASDAAAFVTGQTLLVNGGVVS